MSRFQASACGAIISGRVLVRRGRRELRLVPVVGPYRAPSGEIHGRATAERVIAELHQAGGVDIPREFVIMDRAAIGLSAVFLRLQARVNWHRLFEQLIANFDMAALARRQSEALTRHQVPLPG